MKIQTAKSLNLQTPIGASFPLCVIHLSHQQPSDSKAEQATKLAHI